MKTMVRKFISRLMDITHLWLANFPLGWWGTWWPRSFLLCQGVPILHIKRSPKVALIQYYLNNQKSKYQTLNQNVFYILFFCCLVFLEWFVSPLQLETQQGFMVSSITIYIDNVTEMLINLIYSDIVAVAPNTKPRIVKNIFKRNNNESKEKKVNTPKQAFLQQPGAMQGSLLQHNNFARMSIKNHI